MAGRWAQLTVDAHIAHALDYTKPVSPIAEYAVFDVLELRRVVAKLACYPLLSDDGNRIFVTAESGNKLFDMLLPQEDRVEIPDESGGLQQAIERLSAYKKEHGLT